MNAATHNSKTFAQAAAVAAGPELVLRRKCKCGQHAASGECEECKKKKEQKGAGDPLLQRLALSHGAVGEVPPIVHEVLRSPGQPLDAATLAYFEPRLGQDFSHVRVHADAKAVASAHALNALAYAVGDHVVAGNRNLVSSSPESRSTLAHELVHVMQQRDAPAPSADLRIGDAGSRLEREAESRAQAIEAGTKRFPPSTRSSSLLQRLPIPSVSGPSVPPCPTSIRMGQILRVGHNQALPANRNRYRTYFLGIAKMEVGPGPDHSLHCMQEHLRLVSTNCPASVTNAVAPCSKSDCLPINGNKGGRYPRAGSIKDDKTSFLDEHITHSALSLLEGTGVNSCQTVCDQTYSCDSSLNPVVGPTFRITRTFQAGSDTLPNGSTIHVTTGNVDKIEVAPPAPSNQQPQTIPPGQPLPPPRTLPPGEEYA